MWFAFTVAPIEDPVSADAFRTAARGWSQKSLAIECGVSEGQVAKWMVGGNIPSGRIARLPEPVRCAYYERMAEESGAVVVPGEMCARLVRLTALFSGRFPMAKASLGSALAGPSSGRREVA